MINRLLAEFKCHNCGELVCVPVDWHRAYEPSLLAKTPLPPGWEPDWNPQTRSASPCCNFCYLKHHPDMRVRHT